MYPYHFTQITLKIQLVFKLLEKASHRTKYQGFFVLNHENTDRFRGLIEGLLGLSKEDRLMVMTTDQLL